MTRREEVDRGTTLALVGGALVVLGAVVPWSTTAEQSFSGFEHVDGFVTFGIGVAAGSVALALLAVDRQWDWRGRVVAGCGGLAVVALALKWLFGVLGNPVSGPGIGLPLTLVGGLALLAAAVAGGRTAGATEPLAGSETEPLSGSERHHTVGDEESDESGSSAGDAGDADGGSGATSSSAERPS